MERLVDTTGDEGAGHGVTSEQPAEELAGEQRVAAAEHDSARPLLAEHQATENEGHERQTAGQRPREGRFYVGGRALPQTLGGEGRGGQHDPARDRHRCGAETTKMDGGHGHEDPQQETERGGEPTGTIGYRRSTGEGCPSLDVSADTPANVSKMRCRRRADAVRSLASRSNANGRRAPSV